MIEDLKVDSEPFDRLTMLCKEMTDAIERPENMDVKGIVFLATEHPDDPSQNAGGIQMFGYDDATEGMADLLMHMKAIFQASGKSFGVMSDQGFMIIPEEP